MTEKDIHIEDEETLDEAPVEETDKAAEEEAENTEQSEGRQRMKPLLQRMEPLLLERINLIDTIIMQ